MVRHINIKSASVSVVIVGRSRSPSKISMRLRRSTRAGRCLLAARIRPAGSAAAFLEITLPVGTVLMLPEAANPDGHFRTGRNSDAILYCLNFKLTRLPSFFSGTQKRSRSEDHGRPAKLCHILQTGERRSRFAWSLQDALSRIGAHSIQHSPPSRPFRLLRPTRRH